MDVSGWTVDERMCLPDWCFGNAVILSCRVANNVPNTGKWAISTRVLPDQACIWSVGFWSTANDWAFSHCRMGLRDVVPTSVAEMDTSQNIFPDLGINTYSPPRILVPTQSGWSLHVNVRKGIETAGRKFVCEAFLHAAGNIIGLHMYIVVTGLPTEIPAHLDPNTI